MPVPRTKTLISEVGREVYYYPNAPFVQTYSDTISSSNGNIGGESGHWGYPNFPPRANVGGGLQIVDSGIDKGMVGVGDLVPNGTDIYGRKYTGNMLATYVGLPIPPASLPDAWGPEAYAKMKPTKPSFQALNAVYELREVPGMLRQRFHDRGLAGIGNYHLAIQFGWIPLLNDIRKLVSTQRNMQKRLKQLLRDNGRTIRRRVTLAENTTIGPSTEGNSYASLTPTLHVAYYRKIGTWSSSQFTTDRVWASARMRYWLPGGPQDINWTRRMIARLYGLNPSPSVIYNMIPWSWLVDWFTNTGSLIENMDAGVADRLAYDYCYVMREVTTENRTVGNGFYWHANKVECNVSAQSVAYATSKQRVAGDPFGWNTNQNSLTGMQLSILGALGLSRLR